MYRTCRRARSGGDSSMRKGLDDLIGKVVLQLKQSGPWFVEGAPPYHQAVGTDQLHADPVGLVNWLNRAQKRCWTPSDEATRVGSDCVSTPKRQDRRRGP